MKLLEDGVKMKLGVGRGVYISFGGAVGEVVMGEEGGRLGG